MTTVMSQEERQLVLVHERRMLAAVDLRADAPRHPTFCSTYCIFNDG
jgi:hypothetical protein